MKRTYLIIDSITYRGCSILWLFPEHHPQVFKFNETPKENLREPVKYVGKDLRGTQRPPVVSWCETPKRDSSLRHRLLMRRPTTDVKTDNTRSPCTRRTGRSEHWLSVSCDTLDTMTGALASSTLEHDLPLSGRKRRLLFTQARTSTREDGKPNCFPLPVLIEEFHSQMQTSLRTFLSVCEDSGFSSLTLDKSQDSSVDHDGSFQELLLSTLKEGGSQSEEDTKERKYEHFYKHHGLCKEDEVFAGDATPVGATPVDLSLTPALQLVHAMCQQNAQMFVGQSPSLKEQLKSTAALAETLGTFRTTMPLAGLIGRKMGIGKIDILTELKRRNLRHILAKVFSHLSSENIYRCGQVCKNWSEIIQQDKQARFKRRNHLSKLGGAVHVPDAETRLTLTKRSALKMVQSQSRSLSFCTPQSGKSTLTPLNSGSSRREKFLEVAKTLFNDECLKPCPRCQNPARCHSVKREGVCSTADCGFQFCTACLYAFHGSKECGSRSVGRHKKDIILPGSAKSKRNIRRL
uniref:F-box protein 43 n=1 Tax=Labrus bergylta TaxID=56723 RepID=A0A3Q3GFG1_9LABR